MPRGNIIISTLNKIRPGSTQGFRGISIIDTSHEQRSRPRGVVAVDANRNDPDPQGTSYPIAMAASNVPPRYPTGILNRTDPETGNLPYYERDDPEILDRLFGLGWIQ